MMQTDETRRRILVIEDEPLIGRVCTRTLSALGFEADLATDGLRALEMARREAYDLCLSDIRTPRMNGVEFYQHLAEERPELANRIMFTTGDVLSSDVQAFLDESGAVFLAKPFTSAELRAAVSDALQRGHIADSLTAKPLVT